MASFGHGHGNANSTRDDRARRLYAIPAGSRTMGRRHPPSDKSRLSPPVPRLSLFRLQFVEFIDYHRL